MLLAANVDAADKAEEILEAGRTSQQLIAQAMDQLWQDVLLGTGPGGPALYGALANLGLFFALGTFMLWLTKWTKSMIDDEGNNPISELIWPLIVIVLMSNRGAVLAQCTLELRSIINQTNEKILTSTVDGVRLDEAYRQRMQEIGAQDAIAAIQQQCSSITDPVQQENCNKKAKQDAARIESRLENPPSNSWNPVTNAVDAALSAARQAVAEAIKIILFGLSFAFQWVVEISLLLTALVGPLAVGGTLLPSGQKAMFAWLVGFFSIGMVKLSFNIIVGLVATLTLNSGPTDPLIFALVVGLLSPILSLVIAAGGGMAVFTQINSLATGAAGAAAGAAGGAIGGAIGRGAGAVGGALSKRFSGAAKALKK